MIFSFIWIGSLICWDQYMLLTFPYQAAVFSITGGFQRLCRKRAVGWLKAGCIKSCIFVLSVVKATYYCEKYCNTVSLRGAMFRHDRVAAWYRPLLSLGEALFLSPPLPLAGPPCRAALQSSVGLGEECAGMRSSTDCRKSTQQLAQYGQ